MADAIVRLRVESSEYDQKLSRATQQLQHMEKEVRRTGATFAYADKEEIAFIQSLGSMETKSTSARQKLREYTEAITSMTATYRKMTEEERQSPFGKAMSASIDQLKAKASELQDIMSDTQREIQNLASDTSFTDGIGLMTRTVGSCAAAITAWTGDSKEMEAVIKDLAKIGATVAAVDSLTKAFQKQNLVLLKNPYVAAAAAVVALGVAIGKLIQKSQELDGVQKTLNEVQAKGRDNAAKEMAQIDTLNSILHDNTRSLEDRKAALSEIQALVPDYHGALTAEGTLINDNTGAIDDYIDSLQRAALAQAAFDKMVELQKKKMQQQVELQEKQKNLQVAQDRNKRAQGEVVYAGSEMTQVYTQMDTSSAERAVQQAEADIRATNAEIDALRNLVKATDVSTTTATATTGKGGKTAATGGVTTKELNPLQEAQRKISELSEEALTADEKRKEAIKQEIEGLQAQIAAYKQIQDYVQGIKKDEKPKVEGPSGYSQEGISAFRSEIQGSMKGMQMGSDEYMFQAERLVDLTTFENLLKTATENGIQPDPALLENLFETIDNAEFGVTPSVSDEAWQTLVDQINEKLKELNLPPIELDINTGGVSVDKETKKVKGLGDGWNAVASAIGTVSGALQGLEDPSAKIAGIIGQAIANIALSFAEAAASPAVTGTGWGWLGFAASGIATMIATISSIKSATAGAYANGGIIPGNSFSGDRLTANVNSGELILNRAQQGAIAGQLAGNPMDNLNLSMEVEGTKMLVLLNNVNRSLGGSRDFYTKRH